jgi:hypothetical protein
MWLPDLLFTVFFRCRATLLLAFEPYGTKDPGLVRRMVGDE